MFGCLIGEEEFVVVSWEVFAKLPGVRWWDDDALDGIEFEQDVLVDAPFSFHVVVVVVPFCCCGDEEFVVAEDVRLQEAQHISQVGDAGFVEGWRFGAWLSCERG